MRSTFMLAQAALLLAVTATAAGAQQRPPVRQLGAVTATSTDSLSPAVSIRALSSGGVLVNDPIRRRVTLLDASLGGAKVVVDSTPGALNAYGPRPGGLIAYRGDSTLFVDPASLSMLVIDGAGSVGRVMSVPRSEDAMAFASPAFGAPGFDAQGRLVYRSLPRMNVRRTMGAGGAASHGGAEGTPAMPQMPDTAALVRIDMSSRALDTIGWLKVPRPNISMSQDENGRMQVRMIMNPLPQVDDWTVTPDGAVVFVRGRDYKVERVNPDGSRAEAAKIPFDWKRMTDDDKVAFIDSVKAARERMGSSAPQPMMMGMGGPPGAAGGSMTIVQSETRTMGDGSRRSPQTQEFRSGPANTEFVPPSELPDYRPAFFAGAARADAEGNVWIRTTATPTTAGALVYDVVNAKGELVDRVETPGGRQVVGFGPGGTVFLLARDGNIAKLEKARVK